MKELSFPISKSQTCLLKTIIGNDDTSVENYKKWIDSVNFVNYIDGESYALIPALYKRLSSLGFSDINISRYKGIYKKAFYKNSLLLDIVKKLGHSFNEKNIPFTVLKGIPLLLGYLDDTGQRSMGDADIVVARDDIPEAISILQSHGFSSQCDYDIFENLETRHSYSFKNGKNLEIDLYWTALPVSYKFLKTDPHVKIAYCGIEMNMLSPEDFIFQLCLHGATWNPVVHIRWIFDLFAILSKEPNINWDHFLRKTDGTRISFVFYIQFKCFNEISSIKIPGWVLSALYEEGNNTICRRHAKRHLIPPRTILGRIGWYGYNYQFRNRSFCYRLFHFPRHKVMMSRYSKFSDLTAAYLRKYIFKKGR